MINNNMKPSHRWTSDTLKTLGDITGRLKKSMFITNLKCHISAIAKFTPGMNLLRVPSQDYSVFNV